MKWVGILVAALAFAGFVACGGGDDEPETADDQSTAASTAVTPPRSTSTPLSQPPSGDQLELTKWDLWAGQESQLRGANIHQRLVYPELDGTEYLGPGPVGPPFVQADFDALAGLGANVVNISHPGLFTEDAPYAANPDTIANLDHLLALIEAADMFAAISFRTGPGRSEFTFFDAASWFPESYRNDAVWGDGDAQAGWVEMWRFTAQRYEDSPVVVGYDLMVEPNAEFVCCGIEGEPDEFYPEHADALHDWNAFYPQIIDGIREIDGATPILVGGLGLSAVIWLPHVTPVDDPRVVYMVHQYEPIDYTHLVAEELDGSEYIYPGEFDTDYDDEDDIVDLAWMEANLEPVDSFVAEHGRPVAANEFGPMRFEAGAARFMADQMQLFEERGMNHMLWEWGPAWEPLREDQQEFSFRLGTDPDNYTQDTGSDLRDVIAENWSLNTLRPSGVTFVEP